MSQLVAKDRATHLVILLTTSRVSESLTVQTRPSPTHPVWGGDLPPCRGTLLGGVRHVEVDYTSPASWPTTGDLTSLQKGYHWLSKQSLCSILDFIPRYPSLCLRGAGLAAISWQDLARVGEGGLVLAPWATTGWAMSAKLTTAIIRHTIVFMSGVLNVW